LASAGTNTLGGTVVWLRDLRHGRSFYYAHLQRWAFEGSAAVSAGEVIGFVGNSGNARTTPPHLHFGIYDQGAVDPLPFIRADDPIPLPPRVPLTTLGRLVRVTSARATLRAGEDRSAAARAQLNRSAVARVFGVAGSSVRVNLPDGQMGYLDNVAVADAEAALRRLNLPAGSSLYERPLANAPVVDAIGANTGADVLGEFGAFTLVQLPTGMTGWIKAP
jgi:hypothetical protein